MGRPKKKLEIKPGQKFRWYDRDLWYIVDTLKDGDQELVVLKSWAKYKGYWVYKVESRESMEYWFDIYNSGKKTDAIKSK
jgi:hypothetical protein